ncbi:unnamed protein product [Dovyalis caffra]|uniref:Uncharacterized protein n=1 Tax=Dovyalis caffra TaxID=77055 RepID=A0AAV1S1E4_9ROSI|nr:unnamed protein product [Dovyalis caffra]
MIPSKKFQIQRRTIARNSVQSLCICIKSRICPETKRRLAAPKQFLYLIRTNLKIIMGESHLLCSRENRQKEKAPESRPWRVQRIMLCVVDDDIVAISLFTMEVERQGRAGPFLHHVAPMSASKLTTTTMQAAMDCVLQMVEAALGIGKWEEKRMVDDFSRGILAPLEQPLHMGFHVISSNGVRISTKCP